MDISIIEFGVYGLISYSTFIMLLSSITKELPETKLSTMFRSVVALPGIICSAILSGVGVNIQTNTSTVNNIIKDLNTTDTWQSSTTSLNTVVLQNPIWVTVHFMLFIIMVVFVLIQVVNLLTKKN